MNRYIHILFSLLFAGNMALAQDYYFSQYYSAPWNLGAAFAGTTNGSRLTMNARNQWAQLDNDIITYATSIDHFFTRYHSGVGFYVAQDNVGFNKTVLNNIAMQYSYLINLNQSFSVRAGLQFSYLNHSIKFSDLIFPDQLSYYGIKPPSQVKAHEISDKINLLDFGTSFLLYDDLFWIGFGVDHLAQSNQSLSYSDYTLPVKYSAFGGARIVTKQNLLLRDQEYLYFSLLYLNQATYQQLDIGLYWEDDPLTIGVWYRGLPFVKNKVDSKYLHHDALVFKVGTYFGFLSFGYSYDFTISQLQSATGGAHEISVTYLFNQYQAPYKKKVTAVPCPKF